MNKDHKQADSGWWLDRLILKILTPLLNLFPSKEKVKKAPKVTKVAYGSSEICYCGSGKKYKHCCKKVNKASGKIAIKVIKRTRNGSKERVKVIDQPKAYKKLFPDYVDSGIDPMNM